MSDLWHIAMVDFIFVDIIIMVKIKFDKVKVCVVTANGPFEGDGEEYETFRNNLIMLLEEVNGDFRKIVLGDMDAWISKEDVLKAALEVVT